MVDESCATFVGHGRLSQSGEAGQTSKQMDDEVVQGYFLRRKEVVMTE